MGEQFHLSQLLVEDFGLEQIDLYLCIDKVPIYFVVPIECIDGYYVREVSPDEN